MLNFNLLNLDELVIGFDDLMHSPERQAALLFTGAWNMYQQLFTKTFEKMMTLPEVVKKRPLAQRLREARARYDGNGRSLYHICQACIEDPQSRPEDVAMARAILAAFLPALVELSKGYAAKSAAALRRREKLGLLSDALRSFPLPGGRSLYDVARAYLAAGNEIDGLLTERSHERDLGKGTATLTPALSLRNQAVSGLCAMRDRIAEEIRLNPELPQDLISRVFSKFAELEQLHLQRLAAGSASPAPQPQPPADDVPNEAEL